MIRITDYIILGTSKINFTYSDGSENTIDFRPFIGKDKLSQALSEPDYFQKVKLYEDGRGIFWPNEFDFCADFLHQYEEDKQELIQTDK